MNEKDLETIKGVAAILEYMSDSTGTIKYSGEAFSLLAGLLMDIAQRNEGR
jgi:hypothetical protein